MRRPRTIRAWAVLVWLALWQLGAMAIDQQIILVSPLRVLSRLWELIPTPDFWGSIAYSLVRITAGFLLGVAAGTELAALSARFRRVEELLAPAMLAIKSIPVASFIILALILFSSRNLAVPISFLIVLPVLYSNVLGGIRAADSQLMEMARVFRIPVGRSIRYVYLPQVMPYFLSACGSALGLCWKSGIAAEVIGMPEGSIGEQLQQAKAYLETVRDAKVALFGTLGAWPDSDHARDCIAQGEALVNAPERRNKVLGTYLCQGKVDPKIVAMMQKMASDVHPMTPERKARLEEAAQHPDEADCLRAQEAFKGFAEQVA